jgi:hypothetical protein
MMLKYILAGLAAFVLLTATLVPDDAYARRGGGAGFRGGGGGFHGGGYRGGGMHAGRIHGGHRYAGRVRPSHPIAGRPIAGRPGRPIAGYPGYGGGYRRGLGYGAAAVGAAAAYGAYGAYGNNYGCYYDNYGQYICPQQYQYRYWCDWVQGGGVWPPSFLCFGQGANSSAAAVNCPSNWMRIFVMSAWRCRAIWLSAHNPTDTAPAGDDARQMKEAANRGGLTLWTQRLQSAWPEPIQPQWRIRETLARSSATARTPHFTRVG